MKKRLRISLISMALLSFLSIETFAAELKEEKNQKAGAVRVYRFDSLDIEGNLKTPHLMNFLKRIRNRFRSFRLPNQNLKQKIIETKDADFL